MNLTLRLAAPGDFDPIFQLYFEFHQFHVVGAPKYLRGMAAPDDRSNTELVESLHKIMTGQDSALFVAEHDSELIGLAEIYLVHPDLPDRLVQPVTYGLLQSLIVKESYRGQGLGRLLVEQAERWAREKGATEFRLDVWEFAAGPLRFYERLGYRTIRRTLAKDL